MKSIFIAFGLLTIVPALSLAQSSIESYTPTTAPVIDGNIDEWETEWLADSKGKFAYNIANDDDNLYIRIRMSDPMTQRKVALFGMAIYLNPAGKKKGKMGIKFPLEKDLNSVKKPSADGPMTAEQLIQYNKDLIADSEALELVGLSKQPIVSTRMGLMNGIQLIIVANEAGDYVYEGKIPFKAFKIKKSDVKTLGLTVQTGKLINKTPINNTVPTGGFGGRSNGYGNGYGGGYGGGGYGGGYNQMQMRGSNYSPFNSAAVMTIGIILH